LRLAALGASVAAIDINLRSYTEFKADAATMTADTTVEEIRAVGGSAIGIELDVGDHEAVLALGQQVEREWGQIDVLVANAGGGTGAVAATRASELDPQLIDVVVRRNLLGTMYSCAAVTPAMKRQRQGKIVTVSSAAGSVPVEDGGYAHYSAAKAAIEMYTRSLARELAPFGVNVNCIAPGNIATGRIMRLLGLSGADDDPVDLQRRAALDFGTVEDCAGVVEFLTTDLSDSVTGAVIPIGGWNVGGGRVALGLEPDS
jgi:3-oxoacyl-[acyl-carrier protein] reductase